MTHIHGNIFRIYEVEKDAYPQPISGGTFVDSYSFGGVVPGTSTGWFDIDHTTFIGVNDLLHSINISSGSGSIQRIQFVKFPQVTVLFDAFFRYDSQHQFFLGDIPAYLNPGEYIRVYLTNNAVGNIRFTGTIWWLNTQRPWA